MKNHITKTIFFLILTAICFAFLPNITVQAQAETKEEQMLLLQAQYQQALLAQNAQYQQVMLAQAQYQQAMQFQLLQTQLLQYQYLQAQALNAQALQATQLQAQQIAQYHMIVNTQAYNQANAMVQYDILKTAQNIQLDNLYSLSHATGDHYIFGYTEEYRAEQQRATEAYLRYWGLK